MDFRQGGAIAVAVPLTLLVASLFTWAACRWWYGRLLVAAAQRLQKSEKGRLFSQEQTQQARRQIEQLKNELAAQQQRSAAESQASRRRQAEIEEAMEAAERAAAPSVRMPLVSAHGFADTQILPD